MTPSAILGIQDTISKTKKSSMVNIFVEIVAISFYFSKLFIGKKEYCTLAYFSHFNF